MTTAAILCSEPSERRQPPARPSAACAIPVPIVATSGSSRPRVTHALDHAPSRETCLLAGSSPNTPRAVQVEVELRQPRGLGGASPAGDLNSRSLQSGPRPLRRRAGRQPRPGGDRPRRPRDVLGDAGRAIRWTREVLDADAEVWLGSLAPPPYSRAPAQLSNVRSRTVASDRYSRRSAVRTLPLPPLKDRPIGCAIPGVTSASPADQVRERVRLDPPSRFNLQALVEQRSNHRGWWSLADLL